MESHEDQGKPREGRKKVAIVGFASSWKEAPFQDESVEIWCLNEFWKYAPRWTRWFELHDDETLGVTKRDLTEGEQKRHIEWLKQRHGKPIYMQPQFCDGRFPDAVPYPLETMCDTYGRYFTSSIAYMLALAITDGFEWIGLYGVDLASDVEYPFQRPNTEYFVGLARGKGITVEISPNAALLKGAHLYGYEKSPSESPLVANTKKHLETLKKTHEQKLAELNTLDGAIQANENIIKLAEVLGRGVQAAVI